VEEKKWKGAPWQYNTTRQLDLLPPAWAIIDDTHWDRYGIWNVLKFITGKPEI
jgi:hypothetical protein